MSVQVKFKNLSRAGKRFNPISGDNAVITLGPAKCWNRDPSHGTLSTDVLQENERPPAPRPEPYWIKETKFTWEDCPEGCDFAPFRSVTFYDDNVVKLKKRPNFIPPEMSGVVVEFLLESKSLQFQSISDTGFGAPTRILNHIPARREVMPGSKYAKFHRWIFTDGDGVGHGEQERSEK